MRTDNTKRFSNRVDDYVKYRPGYPKKVISFLQQNYDLKKNNIIADIGSGTGISTSIFLDAGYIVYAVEPNIEMRHKAVELLGKNPNFHQVNGKAEHTGLQPNSIDVIISGQAFHWFDAKSAKLEFKRILKKNGLVVLMWNERKTDSAFEKEYDQLIVRHSKDYVKVDHKNIDDQKLANFFSPDDYYLELFFNQQVFDFNGLLGRLLSSSYMPARNERGYEAVIKDLRLLFDKHKKYEAIIFNYETKVYCGRFKF